MPPKDTRSSRSGRKPTVRRVTTPEALGPVVRSARKAEGVDQVTASGLLGVGPRFLGELERGKANARLHLVLEVLDGLGVEVWLVPRGQRPDGLAEDGGAESGP